MPTLTHFALLAGVLTMAIAGHELTHYLAARALRIDAWFRSATSVSYRIDADRPTWHYRLVGLAPQLTATVLAAVLWQSRSLMSVESLFILGSGVALLGWGSLEDVSVRAARGETPWAVEWWHRQSTRGQASYVGGIGALLAVGVWALLYALSPKAGAIGIYAGAGVFYGALGGAAMLYH